MAAKTALLIAGPTASGKSAVAMRLARKLDGVIVNADSMQVYREMRVLTARPGPEDEASVPHRLYGHVPVSESYSVGKWLADAQAVITEISGSGQRPIFVGGTGLYFNALTRGLSPMPPVREEVRAYWRAEARVRSADMLHAELNRLDPLTAQSVRPTDPQRIVRALEVFQSTGRPLAEWQQDTGVPLLAPGSWRGLVIAPPRSDNIANAMRRFDAMMLHGALEEVQRLREMQLGSDLPAMQALGVAPLLRHLEGSLDLADAVTEGKSQTRKYIKRQLTWLRRYMIAWKWIMD